MKTTKLQQAKKELCEIAKRAKKEYKNDIPAQIMIINDNCYYLSISYNLTNYQNNLLENYACKLHPKG